MLLAHLQAAAESPKVPTPAASGVRGSAPPPEFHAQRAAHHATSGTSFATRCRSGDYHVLLAHLKALPQSPNHSSRPGQMINAFPPGFDAQHGAHQAPSCMSSQARCASNEYQALLAHLQAVPGSPQASSCAAGGVRATAPAFHVFKQPSRHDDSCSPELQLSADSEGAVALEGQGGSVMDFVKAADPDIGAVASPAHAADRHITYPSVMKRYAELETAMAVDAYALQALREANAILARMDLPGDVQYRPVFPRSIMCQLATAERCPPIAAAVAASYVYRLLESACFHECLDELGRPALQEVVEAYPEWMPDAHGPKLADGRVQEAGEHVMAAVQSACLALACAAVNAEAEENSTIRLQALLNSVCGREEWCMTMRQATQLQLLVMQGLEYRLGPEFDLDDPAVPTQPEAVLREPRLRGCSSSSSQSMAVSDGSTDTELDWEASGLDSSVDGAEEGKPAAEDETDVNSGVEGGKVDAADLHASSEAQGSEGEFGSQSASEIALEEGFEIEYEGVAELHTAHNDQCIEAQQEELQLSAESEGAVELPGQNGSGMNSVEGAELEYEGFHEQRAAASEHQNEAQPAQLPLGVQAGVRLQCRLKGSFCWRVRLKCGSRAFRVRGLQLRLMGVWGM
eukprot:jgi/Chrzof1/11008/Cz05g20070.t1